MKTCYICERCGRRFANKGKALECEASHDREKGVDWEVRATDLKLVRTELDSPKRLGIRLDGVSGCLHVTVDARKPGFDENALNILKGTLVDMLIRVNEKLKGLSTNTDGRP